ncbi:beta-ketoadipyl CoA thiolase [Bacillus coahuilensis m2-6]|uniref:acetyl-CoA C-acyltransferase n=1 Tax=Bacillus coahuilensis TaxID=408580 RepID=UPI0007503A9C|nr:acetyl-CoA C-acyltransferase [Bacillus coahuilensis]KUP09301.1 beta-ketoadipyl CoA thiolase [Bacillus coahuilensis m2-6]
MTKVVVVDAVRTPIGRYKGALKDVRPDDLGAIVIKALIKRNPSVLPYLVDEVVLGNANGAGEENRNVGRMSSLLAGLPVTTTGTTINRLCGSGLDAISYGARAILAGEGDIYIVGGTESMTRAPFVMEKPSTHFPRGHQQLLDTTIGWRFINRQMDEMYGTDSMPETAENVASEFAITREAQDHFALLSQQRAKSAMERGIFEYEVISVSYQDKRGEWIIIKNDEHPRPQTSLEKLASLPPIFEGGTVTAGNTSGINDGASALLLMSEEKALELGVQPLAEYVCSATAGVEPRVMGIGPVYSTRKVLERSGIPLEEIDVVELNEAFAAQALACIHELGLNPSIVNVNGGAIAFGHPLGASGARIATTLLHEMKRRDSTYGLATMCIGVGQGISMIFKRI